MKLTCTIFALVLCHSLVGQDFSFPVLKKSVNVANEFFPPNWSIKDSCFGDLNNDHVPDAAFVIECKDTVKEMRLDSNINKARPRIVAIYLRNQVDNTYSLLVQNNTFILRYGEGGGMNPEAYGKISIKNNIFTILFQFLRGSNEYKFRYQQNDMFLIGATSSDVTAGQLDAWDFNFMTKKGKHEWGRISADKLKTKWICLPNLPIKKLRDLLIPFSWEIVPDVFI